VKISASPAFIGLGKREDVVDSAEPIVLYQTRRVLFSVGHLTMIMAAREWVAGLPWRADRARGAPRRAIPAVEFFGE